MASLIWGILFVIAGVAMRLFVGRRKFYRTNEAGVEEFKGYGSALANSALEKILSLGGIVAIIFGALLVATYFFGPSRP
jgi:hypothetical protein